MALAPSLTANHGAILVKIFVSLTVVASNAAEPGAAIVARADAEQFPPAASP
jgi:hypothetical protein